MDQREVARDNHITPNNRREYDLSFMPQDDSRRMVFVSNDGRMTQPDRQGFVQPGKPQKSFHPTHRSQETHAYISPRDFVSSYQPPCETEEDGLILEDAAFVHPQPLTQHGLRSQYHSFGHPQEVAERRRFRELNAFPPENYPSDEEFFGSQLPLYPNFSLAQPRRMNYKKNQPVHPINNEWSQQQNNTSFRPLNGLPSNQNESFHQFPLPPSLPPPLPLPPPGALEYPPLHSPLSPEKKGGTLAASGNLNREEVNDGPFSPHFARKYMLPMNVSLFFLLKKQVERHPECLFEIFGYLISTSLSPCQSFWSLKVGDINSPSPTVDLEIYVRFLPPSRSLSTSISLTWKRWEWMIRESQILFLLFLSEVYPSLFSLFFPLTARTQNKERPKKRARKVHWSN